MQAAQNLISTLNASLEELSQNERRIAQGILDDPNLVTSITSQMLAQRCGVSQSSIIKFCKKIGFSGFPALKIALSAELARSQKAEQIHGDIFSDDPLSEVAQKMYDSKVSALAETLKLNSSDHLSAAVEQITVANRIIILGVGGSALVCSDLASKLTKFGKHVIYGSDAHIQLANLARFTPDDLLILISYSGGSKELKIAAEFADEENIPTLVITGPNSPLRKIGKNLVLKCIASENLVRSSSIATRTAQLAITDLLFILFAQKEADMASKVQESVSLVTKLR